ncbi:MAG: glycoside hydrolase family 3 protein [Bdellovibrionales bacterium]|nr:glycoside hydrolase family 3 protein [Bdellovibrionales bacterium]
MSLDQKVGQLFLIGFPQTSVDPQLEAFVKKYKISSFILFKRNISSLAQVAQMNSKLQNLALESTKTLPFIAVDQEGGQVARVPTRPPIPSAMSIGQTQDSALALSLGQETAKIIRILGFNMNLAPVLDISSPESDSFIGLRSFGSSAENVSSIGVSLSKGLLDEAVIPTAKHFPGVGSINDDPHKKTVEYKASAETLYERDLKPFEEFSKLGSNTAIMLSHFSYPTLDATKTPATLSPKIIKEILRKQIGYNGLVITDDIQMKGLSEVSNPYEAGLRALKAGADIIMMTWSFKDQAKAIEHVKQAVVKGELPMAELNEKVARILAVKKYLHDKTPQLGGIKSPSVIALSTKKLREIESRILDFNIKVAMQKAKSTTGDDRAPAAIPEKSISSKKPICVFSPMTEFIDSFKKSNLPMMAIKTTAKTKPQSLVNSMAKASCSYGVYAVYGRKTAVVLENLPKAIAKKFLVVNLNTPSLIPDSEKFLNVVNLYFPHPEAGKKVADNLRTLARRGAIGDFATNE